MKPMPVKQTIKKLALRVMPKFSMFPTGVTEEKEVQTLISRLHPVQTELTRFGPSGDGGYLIPTDLEGVTYCISPGVSNEAGFELDCARAGMDVFLADASVNEPPISHDRFFFSKKYIGATTAGDFITLDDWVADCSPNKTPGDGLLQMDIEGFEYETILTLSPATLSMFRIIVIEFHHLHLIWSRPFFQLLKATFEKLIQQHACVHIHPNNYLGQHTVNGITTPQAMEFTFLRRDRLSNEIHATQFPHPLDANNYPNQSLDLPKSWFRSLR